MRTLGIFCFLTYRKHYQLIQSNLYSFIGSIYLITFLDQSLQNG